MWDWVSSQPPGETTRGAYTGPGSLFSIILRVLCPNAKEDVFLAMAVIMRCHIYRPSWGCEIPLLGRCSLSARDRAIPTPKFLLD